MTGVPRRPEGGIIQRPGCDPIPLELVYAGIDAEGLHEWVALTSYNRATDRLYFDVFPARTAVVFAGARPSWNPRAVGREPLD